MFMAQQQQLYELQHEAELLKGKKTPETSQALEAIVAVLKAKTNNSYDERLFTDKKHKANNRNIPFIDGKGSGIRQSQADS